MKYIILTNYLPALKTDKIAEWKDCFYPCYTPLVDEFHDLLYTFSKSHSEIPFRDYISISERILQESGVSSVDKIDISTLNEESTIVLLFGIFRRERFSDGLIYRYFQNGIIFQLLERLQQFDQNAQ